LFELVDWAVISTVSGPLGLWAGFMMLFNKVVLTPTRPSSGSTRRVVHRCPPDEVVAIDIQQDNFRGASRTLPYAVLRDGSAFPLWPLTTRITKGEGQLETQRAIVDDLRQALKVGGSDVTEADVQWLATWGK
jgi:hypothetical protein